jgi:hypothetical protein
VAGYKYLHDEPITIVREGEKSSNSEVDDFLTPVQRYGS